MSKKVLLTGAGGSIGVHFIAHIMHNTDWEVVAIDSFRHKGEFDRIREVCSDHPDWPGRIKTITHDLTAPITRRMASEIGKINYVINLASLSDVQASEEDPTQFALNNVQIILNMLDYARENPPDVFLQFSTDEVYGPADIDEAHKEWAPMIPSNTYAASKGSQELFCMAEWRGKGLKLIICNLMNNFGEMQQSSKYPVKIQKWVEAGEEVVVHTGADGQIGTRYYIHSRNTADAVLFIIKNLPPTPHKPGHRDRPDKYHVVGDEQVNNLELAQTIAKLMGKPLKYRLENYHTDHPGHDLHYGLDGTKLKRLGWKSPVDFETSLASTIEWQAQHPEWIDG